MQQNAVVVAAGRRTPIGSFQGQFSGVPATELGAQAIRATLADAKVDGQDIGEVLMGCVLPAGLGQSPARQAALGGGVGIHVPTTTVNKVCGSGMKTIMLGHDLISAGSDTVVLAGGLESMSNAPYLLPKARGGYRMGHGEMLDHMFYDGLQNPYDGKMMGQFAEATADKFGIGREAQDAFAIESVKRAMAAAGSGAFDAEITPVTVTTRRGENVFSADEEPPACDIEKVPHLRPAFRKDGTVTAASSSKISDGAAAVLLMSDVEADKRGLAPLATIVGHGTHAREPEWFTTAPVGAIRNVMEKVDWTDDDVDLYEINEAFAVVTLAAMQELDLDHAKVNVHGGACALGHPIGASGTRLVLTLIHALKARELKRGVAALCIGGGEATAIAVELI